MKIITIFSARIARDLIHRQYKILDIKPHKDMGIKTVFYFEDTENLRCYLETEYNIDINSKRA